MLSELENKIKYYAQKYYEGNPEISDNEFDKLVDKLRLENPNSIILKLVGWGYDPMKTIGTKKNHLYGLVKGIDRKPRSLDQVPDNFKTITSDMRIEAKLDGLSGIAYFKNGKFFLGLTRGNGIVGIDRSDKFISIFERSSKIQNIPDDFTGAIRGEFVISNKNWELFKQKYPDSSNARNTAAGIINSDNIDDRINYVDYVVYKIVAEEDTFYSVELISNLAQWFDHIVPIRFLSEDITHKLLKSWYDEFNNLYPSDGVVLSKTLCKKDSEVIYDEIAYKFDAEPVKAKVIGIDWKRSRLGRLVPTVLIEPTEIDGSTIRRATGFNARFIVDHKITRGTLIKLHKSGCVIPDISEVLVDGVWIEV